MSRRPRSAYRLYVLLSGVGSFASSLAFTLNQVYAVQVVHLDPLQLVLVGTLMEGVCFVAQVPTGVLADLYSRRFAVVAGYLLMGGGLLLWGLVPAYGAILVANAIWAVGAVSTIGAEEAWASDEIAGGSGSGEAGSGGGPSAAGGLVAAAFLRAGQAGQAGTFLGIPAAVGLATLGLNVPIVAAAGLTLALGAWLAAVMPERHFTPAPRGGAATSRSTFQSTSRSTFRSMAVQAAGGARVIRRSRMLAYAVAGTFFIGLASEGFDRLSVAHFIDDMHMPAALAPQVWIGILAAVAAVGGSVALAVVGRHPDRLRGRGPAAVLAGAQVVCSAGMVLFGLAGSFWPAVAAYLVVTTIREAQVPVVNILLVANTASANRATVLSFQQQLDALGQIAGGPPAGYAGARAGAGIGVLTAGAFLAPAVALFALGARRPAQRLAASAASAAEPAAAEG